MIRFALVSFSFLLLILGLVTCHADSDTVAIIGELPDDSIQQVEAPRSLRSLASCPAGDDYRYLSRNSSCTINYLCVRGREPFKIPGCGCGCHTVKVNATAVCPSGDGVGYSSYKYPCVNNYLCSKGKQTFSIPGCGCGCRPVAAPTKPSAPTPRPVVVTKKPTVVCPSGAGVGYFTRTYPCVINFLCVQGKEGFSLPGCGCGCRPVAAPTKPTAPKPSPVARKPTQKPSSTRVCPSGPNYSYFTRNYPCVVNFLCVRGKEAFSIPGCGCGCRTIAPTRSPAVAKPTIKPTLKPFISTNSTTKCPSGPGIVYVYNYYPCFINYLCIASSPVAFSAPGCGCGCKPSN